MATTRPRPMHTSQAATTITTIAKIWPSTLPHIRANAISAMFAALSMSSRQSSTTSGLRRVSTPPAPIANTSAETTRNQLTFTARPPAARRSRPGEAERDAGAVGAGRVEARAEHGDRELDEEREREHHRDPALPAADRR